MAASTASNATILEFARAAAIGLTDTPRWLPSRYLYDARGSQLFEQICTQPEYYPTRTEAAILEAASPAIRDVTGPVTLIELGSGSSIKTDHLLRAYSGDGTAVRYVPVDVSASILRIASERIGEAFPTVDVDGLHGRYEDAFPLLAEHHPALLMFLGSTIGNLNHAESLAFWRHVSRSMPDGSWLLLGADLVKDQALLEAAYNDAAGVSAAFTLNLFARMNRELDAAIQLDQLQHAATWNPSWQRIEIGARFQSDQDVYLAPLDRTIHIAAGDLVMTEISRKFILSHLIEYASCFGFRAAHVATDPKEWFAVLLLQKEGSEHDALDA